MNKLDNDYCNLLQDILENGTKKQTRNGETLSVFGRQIRHSMKDGFPALTTKKLYMKGVIAELLWFLQGRTDLKYLLDNNCHIWDGDCFANYQKEFKKLHYHTAQMSKEEFINRIKTNDEFAEKFGNLGPVYGASWRRWGEEKQMDLDTSIVLRVENGIEKHPYKEFIFKQGIDQIANAIHLLKTDPDSRRNRVQAWNPATVDECVVPPCHTDFQFYTRELSRLERIQLGLKAGWKQSGHIENFENEDLDGWNIPTRAISLMFNMRSNDVPLGLPFNLASYGLLLEIFGKMFNMVPDELICNLGDVHIYTNQIEGIKEQITREPYTLPKLKHLKTDAFYKSLSEDVSLFSHLEITDFTLENYQSHSAIKMPLSN